MKWHVLKLWKPEGETGGSETPPASTPQTIVQSGGSDELVQPVVDHAERLTRMEERQARQEEEHARQLYEMESRINESVSARLSALEEAARAAAEAAAEAAAAPPEEAAATLEEEVEVPHVAPEKPRGMRRRRKARRAK